MNERTKGKEETTPVAFLLDGLLLHRSTLFCAICCSLVPINAMRSVARLASCFQLNFHPKEVWKKNKQVAQRKCRTV
jgi:hypothetical protein